MAHEEYNVTPEDKAALNQNPEDNTEGKSGDGQEDELLAGKFKSAEDLEKAYKELEKKLGEKSTNTNDDNKKSLNIPDNKEGDDETAQAKNIVDKAGLDFDALSAEYTAEGGLSDDSYNKLIEAGIPKAMVDNYIEGMELKAASMRNKVFDAAGGEETYMEMIQWASTSLSTEEVDAFNKAVATGDMNVMKLAVAGVKAKYEASEGSQGRRIQGQPSNNVGDRFLSRAEVTEAMRDPRYAKDPVYRKMVADKLSRSDVF